MSSSNLPKSVAVIGAGTMGNGIAQVFATCGVETHLIDVHEPGLQKGVANVHKSLDKFVAKEKLSAADAEAAKKRLHAATEMSALASVDLCVEAVTENLDVKTKVFQQADELLPAGRDPGQQHLVDLDHRARGADEARGAGHRHALHEPGAADEARRSDPRQRHQ